MLIGITNDLEKRRQHGQPNIGELFHRRITQLAILALNRRQACTDRLSFLSRSRSSVVHRKHLCNWVCACHLGCGHTFNPLPVGGQHKYSLRSGQQRRRK